MKNIIFCLVIILSIFTFSCEKDKSVIDKATDAINEKIDDASKAAQDGIKKAGNVTEKTLDNASKAVEDAMEKVDPSKAMDEASKSIESGLKKAAEGIDKAK